MKVVVVLDGSQSFPVDVDSSMEIENLMALLEAELNIPVASQRLLYRGRELSDMKKSLSDYGVRDQEMIIIERKSAGNDHFDQMRRSVLENTSALGQLQQNDPTMYQAIQQGTEQFRRLVQERERQNQLQMQSLENDPFNADAQKKIEEIIRLKNVEENYQTAMEHYPESFGRVVMLYINCQVNGKSIKAFVDSGAQATIMSKSLAEKTDLMRLLDPRFAGVAMGVGTAKILGRVHLAQLRVGNQFIHCSFTIMEDQGVDLLLGLDMLKRHQMVIDLNKNVLKINNEDVPFLGEHELPASAREQVVSASSPISSPLTSSNANSKYSEDTIKSVMSIGNVPRDVAIRLLDAADGNPDVAAGMLLQ